jgi:pimeloyl-ACP methyl ester carboxylesterase
MRLAMTAAEPDGADGTTKPDVIFIHGTGSNSEMWQPQVDALKVRGYRSFLLDLRGHGATHEPKEPTGIDVHILDVLDTIENSEIKFPAIFVGHSLGAIISLVLAEQRPELFKQIFAVAMPGKILGPVVSGFEVILKLPYERLRGTQIHRKLPWRPRTLISTDRYTMGEIVRNFKNLDYVSRPFKIDCPVHFSAGRFDPVAPLMYVIQMHEALPHSTLKIFEMAGHNFMDQQPIEFNKWLLQYLSENIESTSRRS